MLSCCADIISKCLFTFGIRKAEALNSLIMKITANENDINDKLQMFR